MEWRCFVTYLWNDPRNLAVGAVAHLCLPGGSIWLMLWLLCAIAFLAVGLTLKISHSRVGPEPDLTMCHWTPQVYLPNGVCIHRTV